MCNLKLERSIIKTMRNGLLVFVALLSFNQLFGQNQESHWIFGFNCEMSFDGNTPVDEGLGQLYVTEGSASIANESGDLLFFTDGGMVYDRNGSPMPNGSEVDGHDSSTQNVLIVPQPGDQDERFYFVFSVPSQMDWGGNFTNSGLGMVQVDMQANGGMGDVIGLGTQLTESATEMLHATWHSNGRDVWVVTHSMNSSNWHAFLVTCEGVEEEVVSESGRFFETDEFASNAIGSVKISPQGNKIAATCTVMDPETSINHQTFVLHGSFDNTSGEVSIEGEVLHLTDSSHQGYGLSFSPDGNLLYYSLLASQCKLYQYNFNAPNLAESQVELASGGGAYANIQLAPNGLVYIARGSGSNFLSAIMNPNVPGLDCNYQEVAVELTGLSSLGLPNVWMFPYPEQFVDVQEQNLNLCEGDQIILEAPQSSGNTFLWSNGSTSQQISVSEPGEHTVEVFNSCHLLSRWIFNVNSIETPDLEITNSIDEPCSGDEVEVSVSSSADWSWSDGTNTNPLPVSNSTGLLLTYSENNCFWERDHQITFFSPPIIDVEENYVLCDYQELTLLV
ncbi:MAG: hypothetical protein ACPGWM_03160, partial [Flavobacteriales bacterium]